MEAWQTFIANAQQLGQQAAGIYDFAISQAGDKLLAAGLDGTLRLWDIASTAPMDAGMEQLLQVGVGQQTAVTSVALSPNGRLAAAGDAGGQVICWRVADGSLVQQWAAHVGRVRRVAFLPNSNGLLSIGDDGRLQLWELLTRD